MATPFHDLTPGPSSFVSLLRTFDSQLSGSLSSISDGSGTDSPLSLSTTKVAISGASLQISGVDILPSPNQINQLYRTLADGKVQASKVLTADSSRIVDFVKSGSITGVQLKDFSVNYINHGNISSSGSISVDNAHIHRYVLTANPVTIGGFTTTTSSGQLVHFDLWLKQDSTGGRTISWAETINWYNGVEPGLNSDPGSLNILRFYTYDGGTSWYGMEIATDFQDVELNSPASGHLLQYDGNRWTNVTRAQSHVVSTSGQLLDSPHVSHFIGTTNTVSRNHHTVLEYDPDTAESGFAGILVPPTYNREGITITLYWAAQAATGGDVLWSVALERLAEDIDSIDSDSFTSAKTVTGTASSTSGALTCSSVYFTNSEIDGFLPGEVGTLMVRRDAADGSDTMAGNAHIVRVALYEASPSGC